MTNADPTKILQALLLNPSRSVKAFAKITKKPTKSFNKHFSYLSFKNLRMNEKKQIQNPTLNNIGKPNLIFFFLILVLDPVLVLDLIMNQIIY